jgi:hypothetical protein
LPYGIPGPSRITDSSLTGSQEEPVIISSDDDVKIKVEKIDTKKSVGKKKGKTPVQSSRKKGKAPVQSSSSSSNSSSSSSSDSSGSESENSSNLVNLRRNDMPKELDEALRVNKDIRSVSFDGNDY